MSRFVPRLAAANEVARVAEQWAAITDTDDSPALRETICNRLGWWLGDTPSGRGALAVVEEDGNILGVAGWCPKSLLVEGETVAVAEIGTTMTAPQARGQGVFSSLVELLLTEARSRGIHAIYGTPNAASGAPYVNRLGFKGLWPWMRWIRPIRGAAALPFAALTASRRGAARGSSHGPYSVVHGAPWDELAAFWAATATHENTHIVRSADYLAWRYPSDRYRVWTGRDPVGNLVGWVVTGSTVRLGRPATSLAEIVIGPELEPSMDRFLHAVIGAESQLAPDARLAFAMSAPNSVAARGLRRAGFVGRRSEWALIARVLAGEATTEHLFGSMSLTAGDSDTV